MPEAEQLFGEIVERLAAEPEVQPPSRGSGFGASGLKAGGKLFALLSKGRLVVKLPRQRVDELIGAGTAERFDPGHGRLMKEWATIDPKHDHLWESLAREALQFVRGP
jgi:hypothetical protein